MSTNGHVGTVGQSDSNGALVLQPRDDSWGLCPDSPEEPRRPWHQLDVDMCLVPQWTMPSCPTADWSMMSSSTPVTLRMLSRVEAAAMPPSELRNHMALLQGQLELLLTVNTARKVTPKTWLYLGVGGIQGVTRSCAGGRTIALSGDQGRVVLFTRHDLPSTCRPDGPLLQGPLLQEQANSAPSTTHQLPPLRASRVLPPLPN
jgi:hypothetical protein